MNLVKLTPVETASAIIAAALAFRQKWEADNAERALDRVMVDGNDAEDKKAEEDVWPEFADFVERAGLHKFLAGPGFNQDIRCFAAQKKGEATFTLRAQDITATVVLTNWLEIQTLAPVDADDDKIAGAEAVLKKMKAYPDQKWPD